MNYLVFGLILTGLIFIFIVILNKRKARKQIEQIRAAWGKSKTELFNFDAISKYSEQVRGNSFHLLTDQTIDDIDFYGLFEFIDRTTSKVGQQFLFRKLIEPTELAQDNSRHLVELFSRDTTLRETIQSELLNLNESDACHIPSLLRANLLQKPKWFKFLILDIAIVILLVILSFKYQVFIIFLIIPFGLNIFLHYWNKSNAFKFVRSIPQLNLLIKAAASISTENTLFQNISVQESIFNLKQFQRKSRLITFDNGSGVQSDLNQIGTYFLELAKSFFLIEGISINPVLRTDYFLVIFSFSFYEIFEE